ncbi:MAG: matrixin family metalloprotease [Acidobacteria bacterium]|nr:matrixin family metalloprotease [Acidobacteriota bacterium]
MMNRTNWILLTFVLLTPTLGQAQILGQPPSEACKPGDFAVIGYPDEFGPKSSPNFDVLIDERFRGNFLTQNRTWFNEIVASVNKWNGISEATWNFRIAGVTPDDPSAVDGKLTIAACGFEFGCPSTRPPSPPGGPGGGVIDFRASTLAVTLISQDATLQKGIKDSDIFFNPAIPYGVDQNSGEIDFETVLMHELGHSLGLDHNDNCVVGRTVMESVVDLQELRRDLASSELEGVRFLYPTGDSASIRIWDRDKSVHFDAAVNGFAPFGQEVHIYGHQGQPYSATTSAAWVSVDPPTGLFDPQQHIEILVDQSDMPVGEYTATVSVASEGMPGPPATIEVTMSVVQEITEEDFPLLTSAGTVNGANWRSGDFAPGGLISLFGENFSTTTASASGYPLPETLAGVRVILNGAPAPLTFVSPTQINAVIPADAWLGRGGVIIQNGLGQNRQIPFTITETAPELFIWDSGDVIAFNEDGTMNGAANPAAAGSVITVYLTGVGPVDPPVPTGRPAGTQPLSVSTSEFSAEIGDVPAVVEWLGMAPGFSGLGQANIRIPEGLTGRLTIKLFINGEWSNSNVTVQ